MAEAYLATRISPHLARTPDGFLLCKDVVIARSGPLEYAAAELEIPGGAERVTVYRPVEEVTSRRFLASVEGAVVTDAHPGRFVDGGNFQIYSRGHTQNARVGRRDEKGNATVVADLFINDTGLADKVESGAVRDVSIGYNLELDKDKGGRWLQRNLRVNHVAVVPRGRAGSTKILDAAPQLSLARILADSREEIMESNEDDLITTEDTPRKQSRDAALGILRKIRPEVARNGTDTAKVAWNTLFVAIRDGADPNTALRNLRAQSRAETRLSAADSQEDVRRAVADELVAAASAYLGQDIKEVAARKRTARLEAADESPEERTVSEDFVAKAERAREQLRNRKY